MDIVQGFKKLTLKDDIMHKVKNPIKTCIYNIDRQHKGVGGGGGELGGTEAPQI